MTIRICGYDAPQGRTEFSPACAQIHPALLYRSKTPLPRKRTPGKRRGRKLDFLCIALNAACIALSLLILGSLLGFGS